LLSFAFPCFGALLWRCLKSAQAIVHKHKYKNINININININKIRNNPPPPPFKGAQALIDLFSLLKEREEITNLRIKI
jgi:hypothetical protein